MNHALKPANKPHSATAELFARDAITDHVAVADGYGITLRVHRGHLIINDGIGQHRRQRRYSRAQRTLRRIVILGDTGYLSLEAIRWCADINIAILQLDRDGRLLALAGDPGLDDSRLRRAQAAAASSDVGVHITQRLLDAKLSGQATVAASLLASPEVSDAVDQLRRGLAAAPTLVECREHEAKASILYFNAWAASISGRFAERDATLVPDHWHRFTTRTSPLNRAGHSPRNAANPINALLNYGYALAEAECRISLVAVGLDPGLGIIHTDKANRDSLALDLLESVRPVVERLVLQLVAVRCFAVSDFHETRQGTCRLLAPLTHELAQWLPTLARAIARPAEDVAHLLAGSSPSKIQLRTPLSRSNTIAQQNRGRRSSRRTQPPEPAPLPSCRVCGAQLSQPTRQLCATCWPERRHRLAGDRAKAANAALAAQRADGYDPTNTPDAAKRRSASLSKRKAEELAWTPPAHNHDWTKDWYLAEVLPHIASVPLSALQRATGLSVSACSRIRRGMLIPHRRHWLKLLATASTEGAGQGERATSE